MTEFEKISINMTANILNQGIAAIERKWNDDPRDFKERVSEILTIFKNTEQDLRKLVATA